MPREARATAKIKKKIFIRLTIRKVIKLLKNQKCTSIWGSTENIKLEKF